MSLARRTQERILAMKTASAPASGSGLTPAAHDAPATSAIAPGTDPVVGQIMLRLQHDLRRLKDTKSIDLKVAAKREMLPEYRAWCDGLLDAGRATVGRELHSAGADEVLPTVMVWSIDTGDYARALELAEHVMRFDVPLPARYERDAATLVLEEIAEAAIRAQNRRERFPLAVLDRVEELTAGIDMHDQPRAKLAKAIGTELMAEANATETGPLGATLLSMRALEQLRLADHLHDRSGVKTQLRALEKALGDLAAPKPTPDAAQPDTDTAGTPPAA